MGFLFYEMAVSYNKNMRQPSLFQDWITKRKPARSTGFL